MKKYKVEYAGFNMMFGNQWNVLARNGTVIASTKTEQSTKKIVDGLFLYDIEKEKRANFRL